LTVEPKTVTKFLFFLLLNFAGSSLHLLSKKHKKMCRIMRACNGALTKSKNIANCWITDQH
jgi:hypothetical protein